MEKDGIGHQEQGNHPGGKAAAIGDQRVGLFPANPLIHRLLLLYGGPSISAPGGELTFALFQGDDHAQAESFQYGLQATDLVLARYRDGLLQVIGIGQVLRHRG